MAMALTLCASACDKQTVILDDDSPEAVAFRGKGGDGNGQAARTAPGKSQFDGGMVAYLDREWSQAEQLFQQAVQANPNNADAWQLLGSSLDHQQKFDAAREAYKKAYDLRLNQGYEPEAGVYVSGADTPAATGDQKAAAAGVNTQPKGASAETVPGGGPMAGDKAAQPGS